MERIKDVVRHGAVIPQKAALSQNTAVATIHTRHGIWSLTLITTGSRDVTGTDDLGLD